MFLNSCLGQWNDFQHFNRTNFYFLKFEVFSKSYCLSLYEPMSFFKLGIGLLDSLERRRKDFEDIYITIFSNISL